MTVSFFVISSPTSNGKRQHSQGTAGWRSAKVSGQCHLGNQRWIEHRAVRTSEGPLVLGKHGKIQVITNQREKQCKVWVRCHKKNGGRSRVEVSVSVGMTQKNIVNNRCYQPERLRRAWMTSGDLGWKSLACRKEKFQG